MDLGRHFRLGPMTSKEELVSPRFSLASVALDKRPSLWLKLFNFFNVLFIYLFVCLLRGERERKGAERGKENESQASAALPA